MHLRNFWMDIQGLPSPELQASWTISVKFLVNKFTIVEGHSEE